MANTCTFTGTTNKITECTLGSDKKIEAKVEIYKKGKKENPQNINSPSWTIGRKGLQLVKKYDITIQKGQVELLSEEEKNLKNSINFKLWTSFFNQEWVKCSGTFSEGKITASGSMAIKRVKAFYKDRKLQAPLIGGVTIGQNQFWHFTIRLRGQLKLESQSWINGKVGILNLIKNQSTGKFDILHTYKKDQPDPVSDIEY